MSQAAHRRGATNAPVARLDELFVTEEAPSRRQRIEQHRPWMISAGLQTFISSAVAYTGLHVVNLAPPYVLIVAVCAGGVLVRKAVLVTAEPPWQRVGDVLRPLRVHRHNEPGAWYEGGDGMLDAVRRWDRRLDWGMLAPERFDRTVSERLGELSDERLRQRHGFTRATDPARARGLLGERLWQLIEGTQPRVPTHRQVSAAIDDLERI